MRSLSLLFLLLFLFSGCSKDSQDEEVYGYEVDCDHCNITYLDANERHISVEGQRKSWRIEFRPKFSSQLQVTANSVSVNSGQINVYVLYKGSRVKTSSGTGSVTAQHQVLSSLSKPTSNSNNPSSGATLCGAPTQKGGSCKRKVNGGGRCWQHK